VNDRIATLEKEWNDIDLQMRGDRVVRARNEPVPPSVNERVGKVVGDMWGSTSAPTGGQQEGYRIAGEEFVPLLARVKKMVEVEIRALESELEGGKAPWTPGRVPLWEPR
jgi:hypothetical protein